MKLISGYLRLKSFKKHLNWYQTRTNFLGTQYRKSIFWLLRGHLSRWPSLDKLCKEIKRCEIKFQIFSCQCRHGERWGKSLLRGKYLLRCLKAFLISRAWCFVFDIFASQINVLIKVLKFECFPGVFPVVKKRKLKLLKKLVVEQNLVNFGTIFNFCFRFIFI